MLAGTLQLLGQSNDIGTVGEFAQYGDIVRALQRDAVTFEKTFVDSLGRRVAEELEEQRESSSVELRTATGSLELMDESRVEVDIELSRAMQLIDTTAEWELRELLTFTSTLTGQRHVSSESSPFRPLVYASALWDATCASVSSPTQRVVVLRTAAGVVAGLLKSAWAAAASPPRSPGCAAGCVSHRGAALGRELQPHPAAPRPRGRPARAP